MDTDHSSFLHIEQYGHRPSEAMAVYQHVYNSHRVHVGQLEDDPFTFRYRAVGDAELRLESSAVNAHRWGSIDPQGIYVMGWAAGPGITLDVDRDPMSLRPGVPVMHPEGREFAFDARAATQHVLRFDAAFLERVAAVHRGGEPTPLRFTRHPGREDLLRLREAVAASAPLLLDAALDVDSRRRLNESLAVAVVETFDATPVSGPVLGAGPASMRLAQEFIAAHAREPIGIMDVAHAAGVGARSLQSAFQQHAGMSPLQFLRQVRLHGARNDLRRARPGSTSVSTVARAWGFAHMGRFSTTYAEAFGEHPSETLRLRTPRAPRS